MDDLLSAHTFNEVRYYLMVTACPGCRKGPWQIDSTEASPPDEHRAVVHARCEQCGQSKTFRFRCEGDASGASQNPKQINPTDTPSSIIDLAQWLSLFYMLLESAASAREKSAARRTGFQAALCLAEAMKFYGDDELPDESAFFADETLTVFQDHPEKFARQKLRDMQTKLPTLPRMASRIARDKHAKKKPWWRFWK